MSIDSNINLQFIIYLLQFLNSKIMMFAPVSSHQSQSQGSTYSKFKSQSYKMTSPLKFARQITPIKKLSQQHFQTALNNNPTIKRNNSQKVQYKFTYRSPSITNLNKTKIEAKQITPSKQSGQKKHLCELKNKIIKNLNEAKTIQTKYVNQGTPSEIIEESEIIFRGSRDVENILPLKLTYEDKENIESSSNQSIQRSKQQRSKYLQLIRKTDKQSNLIREIITMGIYGLYHHQLNDYHLYQIDHPSALKIYFKVSSKVWITQPYEYSLRELIRIGKITPKSMKKIIKQLEKIIKEIEKKTNKNIILGPLYDIGFYVHGEIKIIPLIR